MEVSPRAALRDVERATKARRRVDGDAREAMARQADAIRSAIASGVPISELVRVTELTKQRIYQIRDEVSE
jgi:hypothetical protein